MTELIGGIDEVGWGSLAGPVVSAVVVFRLEDFSRIPSGVKDSKKVTEANRTALYMPLCRLAYAVGIGHAWPWEIDRHGPFPALQLSYRRALAEIRKDCQPTTLYVDGDHRIEGWSGHQIVEPKADNKYPSVSAASIIAKVFRDTAMEEYARERRRNHLPDYGWGQNKGYGTEEHTRQILEHGLLIDENGIYMHRQAYCKKFLRGTAKPPKATTFRRTHA